MLWFIIVMIVVGFLAGLIARAIVPGNDSMSLLATTVLGIVGSLVGGLLGWLIFGKDAAAGALNDWTMYMITASYLATCLSGMTPLSRKSSRPTGIEY